MGGGVRTVETNTDSHDDEGLVVCQEQHTLILKWTCEEVDEEISTDCSYTLFVGYTAEIFNKKNMQTYISMGSSYILIQTIWLIYMFCSFLYIV